MDENHHFEAMRLSALPLPALAIVLCLEAVASIHPHSLAINAQLFDIGADVLAFLLVMVVSGISGILDKIGREHLPHHLEQRAIARFNLILMSFGAVFVFARSVLSWDDRSAPEGWADSWIIAGPLLGIFVYSWAQAKVRRLSQVDLGLASLEAHLKADTWVSALVASFTLVSLIFRTGWVNPVGGIFMSLILLKISRDLADHIREETGGSVFWGKR